MADGTIRGGMADGTVHGIIVGIRLGIMAGTMAAGIMAAADGVTPTITTMPEIITIGRRTLPRGLLPQETETLIIILL